MRVNPGTTPQPQRPAAQPPAAPPSAQARSSRRAYDQDCIHPWRGGMDFSRPVDIDAVSLPDAPQAKAPKPSREPRVGPFTREVRPRRARDVSQIPEAVRVQYPHLERALGSVLRVEHYDVPAIRNHVDELALVPENLLKAVRKRGLRDIHLADRPMPELDSNSRYAGQQPRGWQPGATWEGVPGAYNPNSKSVVAGAGRHGSHSVVLHELGHAIGGLMRFEKHKDIDAAHRRLFDKLPPYLKQDGPGGAAGKQEFFAEVFATYVKDGHAAVASEYDAALANFYRDVVLTATR